MAQAQPPPSDVHIIATAGHVDHGKSTLIRALTGTNPDRLEAEQRRGLTIDLGFTFMTLNSGRQVSFVDVPGHIRFLKNMLAGVGAVDAVMFVVSAVEGWKPQSAEHLAILELLDISHGVVVLTHADATDTEGLELARLDVAEHTEGTFLESASVIATGITSSTTSPTETNTTNSITSSTETNTTNSITSSTVGTGLDELRAALDDLTSATPTTADHGRPRLWIDRSFTAPGAGRIVTGTLVGGSLSAGDQLVLAPGGARVGLRAIQSQGVEHDEIGPGHRVALNLTGGSPEQFRRGIAVCRPDQWHITRMFDASLSVLGTLTHDVSRRGAYAIYVGSGEWHVNLRVLGPDELSPGEDGSVRLFVDDKTARAGDGLPLVAGDRFVLRELGRVETVGGGVVLDVDPQLRAAAAAPDRDLDRIIAERGWTDVDLLERLTAERRSPVLGRWVATPEQLNSLVAEVAELVADAGVLGLNVAQLDERQRLALELLDDVVLADGRARAAGEVDVLADHPLIAQLAATPFAPTQPDGVPTGELQELARRGAIVNAEGIWFAGSAVGLATERVAKLLATRPEGVTMAEIRDELGTTRKFALPLMGCLDRSGVTRRRGDLRIAGPRLLSANDQPDAGLSN